MRPGRVCRESGFTLIEVLVAVMLYGIALVSLMGLLVTSITAGTIGESTGQATNLARQRIESLLAMDLPELRGQHGVVTTAQVPPSQGRVYTLTSEVIDQGPRLLITVTVSWSISGAGASRQYNRRLVTSVAE